MSENSSDNPKNPEHRDVEPAFALTANQPPRISEVVADDLRARILGERMSEGARLPSEADLIAMLGVSRATVREALRLLTADGLITVRRGPRGGVTVRHPDPSHISRSLATLVALNDASLRELFDFRLAVEPTAAAAAASRTLSPEDAERLMLAATEHHAAVADRVDFHVLVGELSGNFLSHIVLAALHDVLEWHVELEDLTADDERQTALAHERIATAIIRGNPTAAEKAMSVHLKSFKERMEQAGRLDEAIIPPEHWQRRDDARRGRK